MKNIFKTISSLPPNVKLFQTDKFLFVEGPRGVSCLDLTNVTKKNLPVKDKRMYSSTFFRLFQKQLLGVCLGFVTRLNFVGIGFRIESIENGFLKLKLGFSHFIFIKIPPYINVFGQKKTTLVVESIDDQLLKAFCSKLQALKFPDAYKGKGILYKNQTIILKEGKKK